MHFEAGKRYVTRFVVPFIAVGLLLVALLGPGEQTIAFACIITGTSVFDAFVYSSFAQRVQRTGVSGLRLFAWGQFVIQVAILVAFVLGLALAGRDSTWITTVSLVLVSLIILGGRFDLHGAEKDPTSPATGAPGAAHANPGQVAVGPEDDEAHPVFDCAAFAKRHGYSVREEEILNLVSCGFNAPAIADRLCIAPSTVKTHLVHLYRKAGVADRQELLRKLEESSSASGSPADRFYDASSGRPASRP